MSNVKTESKLLKNNIKKRILINRLFQGLIVILAMLPVIPLVLIIYDITVKGISAISWQFLTTMPVPMGEEGGGILNSLIGTLLLVLIATIFSGLTGICGGIYLAENRKSQLAGGVRWTVDVLQGIPSIVMGIIGYIWFVLPFGGFSGLSGGLTLGLMMLPIVIKSTEETVRLIPNTLKEASLALGVPYYRTILKVILPAAFSGVATGLLLGISRVAGETAPLLFTAFGNPFLSMNILKPVDSLPLLIYNYATSPYENMHTIAWGASFVLVVMILALNLLTRFVVRRRAV